ncbi:MAG: hypothetical protein OHK0019_33060 [Saprospiraceae bacterium]
MTEITIRSSNAAALKKLAELVKLFDFEVVVKNDSAAETTQDENLPITPAAKNADVLALAGIWKGRKITQQDLREKAWGGRL